MTRIPNKGSANQNSPKNGNQFEEFSSEIVPGDNNKGNKRSKGKKDKTNPQGERDNL
ncbi:hypothetical protein [Bacillus pinisoli]|uniref:hypothetical protein n=1 Tax=Bacillus pinisoli TaxID=2901866 RepID=UPI001FF489FC|nr:hypothetical protein [Bacillus pinisoli]